MRPKSIALLLVFSLLISILPAAVFAQNSTLTQTFTSSDQSFTVKYPTGWGILAEDTTDVRFSPSDGSVNSLAVQVSDSDAKALTDVVKEMQQTMSLGATEIPTVVEDNGIQMLYIQGGPYKNLLAGVLFDNGKVGYAIGFTDATDVSQMKQLVMDMAASITIAGGNPVGGAAPATEATAEATTAEATSAAPAPEGLELNPTQVWSATTVGAFGVDVAFSPDSKYVAALGSMANGAPKNDVVLLDAATGKLVQTFSGHERSVSHIAFSPDSQMLASADTESVRVWDVASGQQKISLQKRIISNLAFSPDGASLAYVVDGDTDATINILDITSGTDKVVFSKERQSFTMKFVAYTPDGTLLFVAEDYSQSSDGNVTVWQLNPTTGEAPSVFNQPGGQTIAFSNLSSGNPLIVIGGISGDSTQLWDVKSGTKIADVPPGKTTDGDETGMMAAATDPTGTILATASVNAAVVLHDAKTGAALTVLDNKSQSGQEVSPSSLAFSSDGKQLAVAYEDSTVILWSLTGASAPAADNTTPTTTSGDNTGASSSACSISAPQTANLRTGPGTTFAKAGSLNAGQTASVVGQAQSSDGKTWYQTSDKTWVRSDLVTSSGDCASVPTVSQ